MWSEVCAGLGGPLRAGWPQAPLGSQGHSSDSSAISTHSPAILGGGQHLEWSPSPPETATHFAPRIQRV